MREAFKVTGIVALTILDVLGTMLLAGVKGAADAATPRAEPQPGRVDDEIFRHPSSPYYIGPGNRRGR